MYSSILLYETPSIFVYLYMNPVEAEAHENGGNLQRFPPKVRIVNDLLASNIKLFSLH